MLTVKWHVVCLVRRPLTRVRVARVNQQMWRVQSLK